MGLDWRTSPGYTRRGAYIAASLHDFNDSDDAFGFQLAEYEGIAHLPILREAWVLSFHGRVQTAFDKDGHILGVAARLRQLAFPRSEQPAVASGLAHHGQPLL